jgi:hypothetical protein
MQKASYNEATDLRKENARPKGLVAETVLENRRFEECGLGRTRGRPYHPMTQRKIECYLRNAIQRS